jgi:Ring finger domain
MQSRAATYRSLPACPLILLEPSTGTNVTTRIPTLSRPRAYSDDVYDEISSSKQMHSDAEDDVDSTILLTTTTVTILSLRSLLQALTSSSSRSAAAFTRPGITTTSATTFSASTAASSTDLTATTSLVIAAGMMMLYTVVDGACTYYRFANTWKQIVALHKAHNLQYDVVPQVSALHDDGNVEEDVKSVGTSESQDDPHFTESLNFGVSPCSTEIVPPQFINDSTCPVCLTPFLSQELITSCEEGCLAWFHRDCLFEWLEHSDYCPCCRQDLLHIGPENEFARTRQMPYDKVYKKRDASPGLYCCQDRRSSCKHTASSITRAGRNSDESTDIASRWWGWISSSFSFLPSRSDAHRHSVVHYS